MNKARIALSAEFAVAYSEMLRLTSAKVIIARMMEKAMTWISTMPDSPAWVARMVRVLWAAAWGLGSCMIGLYLPARTTAWVSTVNGVTELTPWTVVATSIRRTRYRSVLLSGTLRSAPPWLAAL